MDYLKIDKKEAIEWFQEKGLLITKKSISDIRVTLPTITDQQSQYLL